MFLSGAPDNIKQWKCPNGDFMQNMSGHNAVINTLAINSAEVVFSGGRRQRARVPVRVVAVWPRARDTHGHTREVVREGWPWAPARPR